MTKPEPYAEYKESGVEWLGQLPADWDVRRIKMSVASGRNGIWGQEPEGDPNAVWCIRVADFDRTKQLVSSSQRTMRYVTPEELSPRRLSRGDLLLEKSGGGENNPVGFVVRYDHYGTAVCSNFVARLQLREGMDSRFWAYVHATTYSVRLTQRSIKQTSGIQNLDQASYFNELAPFPSLNTQIRIADFLDRETAQIDTLIAKQVRLIELLDEKRQAVITHAVTKGLDPTAPTKSSGISWLGDVPAHWAIRKFSQVTTINGGQVDPREEPWASMLLIAPNHVESGTGKITHRETSADQGADSGKYLVKAGEVIYSKIRPYLRKVVIAPEDCLCSADMYGIRAIHGTMSNRFLQELMLSKPFTDFTSDSSARVAMPKINRESLAQGFLWFPPLEEQENILEYIDMQSESIDRLEGRARKFIELLRERRSALISAAVTGKIDVRKEGS